MKNENQMAPHVRKTVEEIDGDIVALTRDINRLTDTRQALVDLYGGETDVPAAPTVQTPKRAPKPKGGGRPVAAGIGSGRAPTADTVKLMVATRSAAEPFTAISLALATGLEAKCCSNRLFKWQEKKYVEKVGRGAFNRSATFPAETPTE